MNINNVPFQSSIHRIPSTDRNTNLMPDNTKLESNRKKMGVFFPFSIGLFGELYCAAQALANYNYGCTSVSPFPVCLPVLCCCIWQLQSEGPESDCELKNKSQKKIWNKKLPSKKVKILTPEEILKIRVLVSTLPQLGSTRLVIERL